MDALRSTNRANVVAAMNDVLGDWITAAHREIWPSKNKRDAYLAEFGDFAEWADTYGLDYMPSNAHVVAAYLCELKRNGEPHKRIRRAAAAIQFFHDVEQRYLDHTPITAAVRYCEEN
jgi:site-specific recombinase XerD